MLLPAGLFKAPNVDELRRRGDVPGLIRALRHRDDFVRIMAARALGDLRDPRAIGPLSAALGRMPAPGGETLVPDLDTARHLIDVLGMLEQKTRGNLDESEQKLLQSLTYDLRVAFVDSAASARRA